MQRISRGGSVFFLSLTLLFTGLWVPSPATAVSSSDVAADRSPGGSRVDFGAYVEGMQEDPQAFDDFEQLVGAEMGVASYYYGFGDIFPGPVEQNFAEGGQRKVLLSWDMGPTRFGQWARGRYDRYLRKIAKAARNYPHLIYVRPWPEMNGDWQQFQPTAPGARSKRYGGSYAQFVRAWRHVVKFTRKRGATNIRWVFNPAADTYAETTPIRKIWPGARYVHVLGIDGFNWGQDGQWGRWRSFEKIFRPMYRKLTRLHRRAPVWICEFGSKEPLKEDGAPADPGRSKASWLRAAFRPSKMNRIEALIYFQADKERDWRINSSPKPLHTVQALLAGRLPSIITPP